MARTTKWTDEKLKALKLPADKREARSLVAPNLYLYARRNAAGDVSKQWQYRSQVNGKRRWLSLGSFPIVTLANANAKLAKLHADHDAAKRGEADHPVLAARHARETALGQPTVKEAFEAWLCDKQLGSARTGGRPVRQRTLDVLRESFEGDIERLIGQSKIGKITQDALQRCIDEPRKRGAPGAAAHVFRTLKGLIAFAERRGYIDGKNPMTAISNPKPYRPAEIVVAANDEEISALFEAMEGSRLSDCVRRAIELQLLTGARPGEVREMTISDLQKSGTIWQIPGHKSKTGRPLKIFLSGPARKLVEAAVGSAVGGFLFPSRTEKGSPGAMDKMAVARALARLEPRMVALGGKKLRPHDLRRTFRTTASRIGVAPHIAELCLGHTETETMRRVYDGHDYAAELADAWELVGAHIATLKIKAIDKLEAGGNR